VPFIRAQDWLFAKKSNAFNAGKHAWVWDWVDGAWRRCKRDDVLPGRTLLVTAASGGYDALLGFNGASKNPVPDVPPPVVSEVDQADNAQDREDLSAYPWRTIATHGRDVADEVRRIGAALDLDASLIEHVALAGQLHDLGKAHPAFQGSIGEASAPRPQRQDLAKAPAEAWADPRELYRIAETGERRPGFRHELASALALFVWLHEMQPDHPALLGRWTELLRSIGRAREWPARDASTPIEKKVLGLSAEMFDLVVYLVLSHHGKVRCSLHSSPSDQTFVPRSRDDHGMPIRGVCEGDVIPPVHIDPDSNALPALALTLEPAAVGISSVTGASWADRVQALVRAHGPAVLAFYEAWLRAADIRASRAPLPADPLIVGGGK
jgi:CRISPR-associated endonuclease/helicase Cas3